MRIELTCAGCGKNRLAFPPGDDDDAVVTCGDCGHPIGTLGALKESVARAVSRETASRLAGRSIRPPPRSTRS